MPRPVLPAPLASTSRLRGVTHSTTGWRSARLARCTVWTMTASSRFAGVGVALPTLRDTAGHVDTAAHRRLATHLAGPARILLVGGTTGRGSTLSHTDRVDLLDASRGTAALLCGSSPHADPHELAALGLELVVYHHPSHHDPVSSGWFAPLAEAGIPVKNSDPDAAVLAAMLTAGVHVLVGSTARLGDAPRAAGVLSGLGSVCLADVAAAATGDPAALERLHRFERDVAADRIGHVERLARDLVASL